MRDIERSIRFYESLGFTKVDDFILDDDNVGEAMGIKAGKMRAAFMRLGDDPQSPVLDILQFIDPPPQGESYPTLNNIGICRLAYLVDDIDATYTKLQALGVEFVGPLKWMNFPGAVKVNAILFKDPDGTVLEAFSRKAVR